MAVPSPAPRRADTELALPTCAASCPLPGLPVCLALPAPEDSARWQAQESSGSSRPGLLPRRSASPRAACFTASRRTLNLLQFYFWLKGRVWLILYPHQGHSMSTIRVYD